MSEAGDVGPGVERVLGHLHLRELLDEVRDRVAEIIEVRDRLDRLVEHRFGAVQSAIHHGKSE